MADIHVLTGARAGTNNRAVRKSYAFHFPIDLADQVANAALDPELVVFVSAVPDIEASELAAIQAGEIVERIVTMDYLRTKSNADILVDIQAVYNSMETTVSIEYIEKYRQYLAQVTA